VTTISSLFAYVWLYIVLGVSTKDNVTMTEAIITLAFFFVLVILAYLADR
jgi:solute carrier family 8 (sodium/calcium exchanger)